jgi:hypothetical protein
MTIGVKTWKQTDISRFRFVMVAYSENPLRGEPRAELHQVLEEAEGIRYQ